MAEDIINRVANSALVSLDLEELYPQGRRVSLDIAPWLLEGIVLREKDFRAQAKQHDWSQYQDTYVSLYCSTDAIIPAWAYMLLTMELTPFAKKVVVGTQNDLEQVLFAQLLDQLPVQEYENKPVIIKGCTNKPIPENAYILLAQRLQPVARSIMYGEACSSVPLYKQKK